MGATSLNAWQPKSNLILDHNVVQLEKKLTHVADRIQVLFRQLSFDQTLRFVIAFLKQPTDDLSKRCAANLSSINRCQSRYVRMGGSQNGVP